MTFRRPESVLVLVAAAVALISGSAALDGAPLPADAASASPASILPPSPQYHECGDEPFVRHERHDPIRIVGNENFTAANGVRRGAGTESDPYIIEGWLIYPNGTAGIVVEDTSAPFSIFNNVVCYGRSGTTGFDGVHLHRVEHARVEETVLRCNLVGLVVTESRDVRASNLYIPGQEYPCGAPYGADPVERGIVVRNASDVVMTGITFGYGTSRLGLELDHVTDVHLSRMEFYSTREAARGTSVDNVTFVDSEIGGGGGFSLAGSSRILFEGNSVRWTLYGIRLVDSDNATIRANEYANHGGGGVVLESSRDVVVENNSFEGPYGTGFLAYSSRRGVITNNTFRDRIWAVILRDSVEFSVHHNLFLGNEVPAEDDRGFENRWDDGYPSGGNFWSDYSGEDRFSGPNQDQPGSDSIGDTPRIVDGDSLDRYPLFWHDWERSPAPLPIRGLGPPHGGEIPRGCPDRPSGALPNEGTRSARVKG